MWQIQALLGRRTCPGQVQAPGRGVHHELWTLVVDSAAHMPLVSMPGPTMFPSPAVLPRLCSPFRPLPQEHGGEPLVSTPCVLVPILEFFALCASSASLSGL